MVKPTLHEWDGKKPEQFMKVLCELGLSGKEEWVKNAVKKLNNVKFES